MKPFSKSTLIYIAILFAAGSTLVTGSFAKNKSSQTEPYKGAYYYTPKAVRNKFKTEKLSLIQAGVPTAYTVIYTPTFNMRMPEPTEWVLTTDPATSIAFRHLKINGAQFSFTLYSDRRLFLPSLEPPSIQGYVEGIKRKYMGLLELINEGKYDSSGPHSFRTILGEKFSYIHYKVKDSRQKNKYEIHLDYFFEINKEIMMLRFACPEENKKEAIERFDFYIKRLLLLRGEVKKPVNKRK